MDVDSSYLKSKTTRQEVESRFDFATAPDHFREDWERLLSRFQPGDEFWSFEPPTNNVISLWGVALVRSGKVISTLIEAVD
jgi:hypothetical protein